MSVITAPAQIQSRTTGRSVLAIAAGLITNVVLSSAVDQVMHSLNVFPSSAEYMGNGQFALAVAYRTVFMVLGGYLTARLAPRNAMRHVWILIAIGTVPAIGGVIAAIVGDLGPVWYPVALVVIAAPATWLGGIARRRIS
ncbi:hypothetical protein [Antrihabitans cavernicola]|uniref:MFS transporter n=1 Tax=Antrihabitans cavernicola TaxID=2495913 RepID=A0A5A7S4X3_9NOCA|nr:hypothetical protein [Spelaeibacter cavernicola]KAA0017393.1 hypothetical protein FOY51_25185 [Spelaeibacter cavernicola]